MQRSATQSHIFPVLLRIQYLRCWHF